MLIEETPCELSPYVWMLGTAAYPVYLVRGGREGAVIEGGISALGPLLKQQLHELGVGPQYVRQAVITHAHPDHVMAIPALREMFPGLSVLASGVAAATLTSEKAIAFFRQIDSFLDRGPAQVRRHGRTPARPRRPTTASPWTAWWGRAT